MSAAALLRGRIVEGYRHLPASSWLCRAVRGVVRRLARLEDPPPAEPAGAWYDLATNGEAALLERLARATTVDTVVDVGANTGDWYRAARDAFPRARVICVEIAPPLWPGLEELLAADPWAELVRDGLGETDDRLILRYYPDLPALSTLVPFPHGGAYEEIEVDVRSVEGFLADMGLSSIDVVKLDIEGMELPVVEGLVPRLADHAVGLVQFEYGQANILSRAPLHAYAEIARSTGYALGEVRPDGVVFAAYTFDAEDHRPRNMVLCRPDLVAAVAAP